MAVRTITKQQLAQSVLGAAEGIFFKALQRLKIQIPFKGNLLAVGSGLLHHLQQLGEKVVTISADPLQHDL